MNTKSLKRNFLYSSSYQILLVITPLITTPWLSRTIGAEGNGIFTYTQTIANYFVMASTLGLANYGVRIIAECGDNRDRRSLIFWQTITMSIIVGFIVFLAYILYSITLGSSYRVYFAIWGLWVLGSVGDTSWLFFGCQEFKLPTIRSSITRLISVAIILLYVHNPNDTWIYVFAISSAYFVNSIFLWPFVFRYINWKQPTLKDSFSHLIPNIALFIPVLATSLYTLMDKVMLGSIAGMTQVGLFDYAEKTAKMPLSVITALGAVVLPRMSSMISEGKIEECKSLVGDTMWFMQTCAIAISFGISAVAPEFVPLFFGEGYAELVTLMRLLSTLLPLICATNVIGVQWLLPLHHDKEFTLSVLFGAGVDIIFNISLIDRYGALGAAVATIFAEIIVLIIQSIYVSKELRVRLLIYPCLPYVVIGYIMYLLIRFISMILPIGWLSLLVETCLGALVYILLSVLWSQRMENERLRNVLPRLARE